MHWPGFRQPFVRLIGLLVVVGFLATTCQAGAAMRPPIKIGLIAPLTGNLAASGEAIRRGMLHDLG